MINYVVLFVFVFYCWFNCLFFVCLIEDMLDVIFEFVFEGIDVYEFCVYFVEKVLGRKVCDLIEDLFFYNEEM